MTRILTVLLALLLPVMAQAQKIFPHVDIAGVGQRQEIGNNCLDADLFPYPVGWFTFSHNDTPVLDLSGNGNTGTVVGATWTDRTMSFDGFNDSINWNAAAADINGSSGTVAMWIWTTFDVTNGEPDNNSTNKIMDSKNSADNKGRLLFTLDNGVGLAGRMYDNGGTSRGTTDTTSDWPASNWVHVAFVWDYAANDARIYVNGVLTSDGNLGAATAYNRGAATFDCIVGSRSAYIGLAQYFSGRMDKVQPYSRALTSNQVYRLSQQTHE